LRVHFLLFGSYRINETKDAPPRLHLQFKKGELNFYACAIREVEGSPDDIYDWSADVMNDDWNPRKAKEKIKKTPKELACDTLLNQDIFAGVGNIIKNEVLYRIRVHPKSLVGKLPSRQLNEMVRQASTYSFDFLAWKKEFVLKKHLLAHNKKTCQRCNLPFEKEIIGKTKRRAFFCNNCQVLYK
jgi:endonuclease-8